MKAVILAGGIGTRLRPLTYIMPKPLLPVGGKPLLEHTVRYLKEYGVDNIVVCVAYLRNQIKEYLKDGSDLGVKVMYAESDRPMDTGGQLKTAEEFIKEDKLLVMNGDIVTTLNIKNLIKFHDENGGIGTIALKNFNVQVPYGYITLDSSNKIIKFEEKPKLIIPANAGIYVFERRIFSYIPSNKFVSLETETFPSLIQSGESVNGYFEEGYWADIGTITDFERVDKELLSRYLEK